MDKKIAYALIAVVAIAAVAIAAALILMSAGKGLCGPDGLEVGFGTEHCKRDCATDSDCVFSCGCGAINANETCIGGEQINCLVALPVRCRQGQCEIDTVVVDGGNSPKGCDEYECPMTAEQKEECICPEGQKKFGSMCGAYCATDSQKPCNSTNDCPEGESCISEDGEKWYCTGQWAGCYHDNPENPVQVICVD